MGKLALFGLLIIAAALEAGGDAIVRMGLNQPAPGLRVLLFAGGATVLFTYGLTLNLAPIEFGKVVGLYIAILFVVWQAINFIAFRSLPTLPILVGGGLIVAGGLLVTFWQPD